MQEFSPRTREANLARMASDTWDVLVIGGGIVGAGIARDAALRGMRVALVERTDFAAGTSGKTSKLVHGGLRYLQSLRFSLVRTAVRERELLLRLEPRLVRPVSFLIPIHRGGYSGMFVRLGLRVYRGFAGRRGDPARAVVGRDELAVSEPKLRPPGLRGAGQYVDALVPDHRLVVETIRSAAEHGAVIANHAEVVELFRDAGRIAGARVRDRLAGRECIVRARIVVNATGVWVDRVRGWAGGAGPRLRPTKGIHVLVPQSRVGNLHAIATRTEDGRLVFVIPWGEFALIGTTDTDYGGDLDVVRASAHDVAYLLEAANRVFPEAQLTSADVVSTYAGLRPLVDSRRRRRESNVSREHVFLEDAGMVSVAGGKLTTHRAMAKELVDRLVRRLAPDSFGPCLTDTVSLRHASSGVVVARFREAVRDPAATERTLSWYDAADMLEHISVRPGSGEAIEGARYLWAEVDHAVAHEMACTLSDVMVRRLWLLHESRNHGSSIAPFVAGRMAEILGWDSERVRRELAEYERLVAMCVPEGS